MIIDNYCNYCRDSSCACLAINNATKYGRISRFFIVRVYNEDSDDDDSASTNDTSFTEYFFTEVETYKIITLLNNRNYTGQTILRKPRQGREEIKIVELGVIKHKCIFLHCSKFDTMCGRKVFISTKLLNHVSQSQVLHAT